MGRALGPYPSWHQIPGVQALGSAAPALDGQEEHGGLVLCPVPPCVPEEPATLGQ